MLKLLKITQQERERLLELLKTSWVFILGFCVVAGVLIWRHRQDMKAGKNLAAIIKKRGVRVVRRNKNDEWEVVKDAFKFYTVSGK